jgi:hypothetical protein
MEDNMRDIRRMLAQGRQQLQQGMTSLQNYTQFKGVNEEFANCLRQYQELGTKFHADI